MSQALDTTGELALYTSFAPELSSSGGQISTTSKQVAEHFGKRHSDVMRAIKTLECSAEFSLRNFAQSEFVDERGKRRSAYRMTRDGFVFLAMGFTGPEAAQWKEAYIEAFNTMEAELRNRQKEAALQVERRLQLQVQNLSGVVAGLQAKDEERVTDIIGLQNQLIASQVKQLRLMGAVQNLHRSREKQSARQTMIQMAREGKTRDQIVAATGRTHNHVRQVLFQARAAGTLPPLDAVASAQAGLFTDEAARTQTD